MFIILFVKIMISIPEKSSVAIALHMGESFEKHVDS